MQRTEALRLKLAPEMMERLQRCATSFGMPEATVAAFAVADFLNRQEMQVNAVRMAALDMSRRASADFASDDVLDKAFERVMPALLAQLNVEQLEKLGDSVGREEPKGSE